MISFNLTYWAFYNKRMLNVIVTCVFARLGECVRLRVTLRKQIGPASILWILCENIYSSDKHCICIDTGIRHTVVTNNNTDSQV